MFLITKISSVFVTYSESNIYHFLRRKWNKDCPMRIAEAEAKTERQLSDIDDDDSYTSDVSYPGVAPEIIIDMQPFQNMVSTGTEVRPNHEPQTPNREPRLQRVSWWRRRALMSFFGVVML
jgi:hypothetical protein